MSSLRNAIPRRPHKERSQPQTRSRHGLLEKHNDYSLRAADHNLKKARLRILRQKATDRNPDEFHFGMMSSRTRNGGIRVADRGNKALSEGVVKLLKTQDAGYLKTMAVRARRERQRLEEEVILCVKKSGKDEVVELKTLKQGKADSKGKHTVFVEDEIAQRGFSAQEWFGTDANGLFRAFNRPMTTAIMQVSDNLAVGPVLKNKTQCQKEAEQEARKKERALQKKREQDQERKRLHLEAVKTQENDLMIAEEELDRQRCKMNNNVGGINKKGIKFKVRERKR